MNAGFMFGATDTGTRVTCETTMKPTGFWRLFACSWCGGPKTDRAQFEKAKHRLN